MYSGVLVAAFAGLLVGGVAGSVIQKNRSNAKFAKTRQEMLKYVELQEEIQKQQLNYWQKNYNKLYAAYEQLQKETIERDYEEVCYL